MTEFAAEVSSPDPLYFQQASMLMLAFRFKGTRKVVASKLMATTDFQTELSEHLPVLEKVYPDYDVNAVEIVSYQKGTFFYDPWPGGMKLVEAYRSQRSEPAKLYEAA